MSQGAVQLSDARRTPCLISLSTFHVALLLLFVFFVMPMSASCDTINLASYKPIVTCVISCHEIRANCAPASNTVVDLEDSIEHISVGLTGCIIIALPIMLLLK